MSITIEFVVPVVGVVVYGLLAVGVERRFEYGIDAASRTILNVVTSRAVPVFPGLRTVLRRSILAVGLRAASDIWMTLISDS